MFGVTMRSDRQRDRSERRPERLTSAERDFIREVIDQARRAEIDWNGDRRCMGCGVEIYDEFLATCRYVLGCAWCADRHSKRAKRSR